MPEQAPVQSHPQSCSLEVASILRERAESTGAPAGRIRRVLLDCPYSTREPPEKPGSASLTAKVSQTTAFGPDFKFYHSFATSFPFSCVVKPLHQQVRFNPSSGWTMFAENEVLCAEALSRPLRKGCCHRCKPSVIAVCEAAGRPPYPSATTTTVAARRGR